MIVKYTDGTSETVKEALADGRITIDYIDKSGINYIKEPKPVYIQMTESEVDFTLCFLCIFHFPFSI